MNAFLMMSALVAGADAPPAAMPAPPVIAAAPAMLAPVADCGGCASGNCAAGMSSCCSDPNPNAPGLFSKFKKTLSALRPANLFAKVGGGHTAGGCDGCGAPAPACDTCGSAAWGGEWGGNGARLGLFARLRNRIAAPAAAAYDAGCGGAPACGCSAVTAFSGCGTTGCGGPTGCALPPVPGTIVTPPATESPKEMPKPPAEAPKADPKKDEKKIAIPSLTPAGSQVPALGGSTSSF